MTEERILKLLRAVASGSFLNIAATYAGIHDKTLTSWIKKGRAAFDAGEEDDDYYKFFVRFDEAEQLAELRHVFNWVRIAEESGDWRASAEFLARRFPDRWSPSRTIEVKEEVDLNVILKHLPEVEGIDVDALLAASKVIEASEDEDDA